MLDMIIASLLKIWHIIPIVIAIILFKKFINNKDKKHSINKNKENEKKGLTLEVRTQKKYKNLGYQIKHHEKKENQDLQAIDFICTRKEKVLIIQCKDSSKSKSIIDKDIKIFYDNAMEYIKTNNIKEKDVEFRYVIPYSDILHKSASKMLMDDTYNCKYVVI